MNTPAPCPLTDGDLTLILREFSRGFLSDGIVPQYSFRMRLEGVREEVGKIDLRTSLTPELEIYGGNIGYEVKEPFRGRRLALRSLLLVADFALQLGIPRLLITCAETNFASRLTCERSGAVLDKVDLIDNPDTGIRPTCYYWLQTNPIAKETGP